MVKGNDPEGIGDILKALKKSGELSHHFEEAKIWERWPELAGDPLMHHGRPLGVRDGTLLIEVDSAVWMHKFSYERDRIIRGIHRIVGPDIVSDLFLTLTEEEKRDDPQDSV